MPTYSYRCVMCKHVQDNQSSIKDRDLPVACEMCGGKAHRNWSGEGVLPMAMLNGMADGHVPDRRAGEFANEKEATRLQIESYEMPVEKRSKINKEIKNLRKVKK